MRTAPKSVSDRAYGHTNTHPRLHPDGRAGVILEPEDIQEGQGDFVEVDPVTGDPVGYEIGKVEERDGQNFYIGPTPDTTIKQNASPHSPSKNSFLGSQPLVESGAPPPKIGSPLLAPLPAPPKPFFRKVSALQLGFPTTTPSSPLWYAYAWVRDGRLSLASPPVPFQVSNGQGARVTWGDAPEGITQVALILSQPGTSSSTTPGPMFVQRIVDLNKHRTGSYDLTGPFEAVKPVSNVDETALPRPAMPRNTWQSGYETHGGIFHFYVTWVDKYGNESLPSQPGNFASTRWDVWWIWNQHFRVHRPSAPPGAVGWKLYANVKQNALQSSYGEGTGGGSEGMYQWYHRNTREGLDYPIPISTTSVPFIGETSEGLWRFPFDLKSGNPPTANSTGIASPDAAPETPIAFGASYPEPGRYYGRTADTLGTRESLPSEAAVVDVGTGELMQLVYVGHTNALANGNFAEVDASGIPLAFSVTSGAGEVRMDNEDLLLDSAGSQTGTTKTVVAEPGSVNISKTWQAWSKLTVGLPTNGTYAGSVELVLRQFTSTGSSTDTVLYTATAAGVYEPAITINPTGGGGTAWASTTTQASLVVRFAGATKNLKVKVGWLVLKDHTHQFRWGDVSSPSGSQTQIGLPPDPVPPPVTFSIPEPDSPKLTGTVEETITYNSGLPGGWTTTASGGATLSASAAAALTGAQGLRLQKTTGGTLSSANQKKTRSARANDALLARFKPATLPAGKLVMNGLGRPSDGTVFAWLETGSQAEVSKLVITSPPTDPGNVSVEPQGALQNVAVVATKEVATLALTGSPSTFGTLTLNLNGVAHNFEVGGSKSVESLTVQSPKFNGYVTITLNSVAYNVTVRKGDSANEAAKRIRETVFPGWRTGGRKNTVTFESTTVGIKTAPVYNPGTSATPGTIATIVAGSAETATELATRIRSTTFTDWIVTGSGTSATFTAVAAGSKTDASVNVGTTGATATMTTNTQGAVDTTADLAARIRGTSFTGWTLSGSGSEVVFTSTTAGVRTNLRFNPNLTGAKGTVTLISEGKNADLSVHLKDESGTEHRRRIMDSLSTSTIYNVDLTVTGAGTEHASVTAWGSTGAGTKTVLADWPDVDLSSYPAGHLVKGVISESSAASTWDLHMDDVKVTDGGETRFERHNAPGKRINQLHHYGVPAQPVRQDLLVRDRIDPVLPNKTYVYAAKIRYKNIPTLRARPLTISALKTDGSEEVIGDVTGTLGITGTAAWAEYTLPITTQSDWFALRANSLDIGVGEIVIQQIVLSPGTTPKRTYRYATSGVYSIPLGAATPNQPRFTYFSKVREELANDITVPDGTAATIRYRSAQTQSALSSATWQTDPALVLDLPFVAVESTLTGDGLKTPEVLPDSPRVETRMVLGHRPEATLLDADAREYDGGTIFEKLQEWAPVEEVAMQVLPGGRLRPHVLSEAVGELLESSVHCFTPETRRKLESSWYEPKTIEAFGMSARVRFSEKFKFERKSQLHYINGKTYAWYTAKLPGGEILEESDRNASP